MPTLKRTLEVDSCSGRSRVLDGRFHSGGRSNHDSALFPVGLCSEYRRYSQPDSIVQWKNSILVGSKPRGEGRLG
jgi:hypothetical protein